MSFKQVISLIVKILPILKKHNVIYERNVNLDALLNAMPEIFDELQGVGLNVNEYRDYLELVRLILPLLSR